MWEWSNKQKSKTISSEKPNKNSASLLTAYNDLIGNSYSAYHNRIKNIQIADTPENEPISSPSPEEVYNLVQKKISELKLPKNTQIMEREYTPQSWQEMNKAFDRYHNLRARFFKLLGYSEQEECLQAGLNEADINTLREGFAPENFNIHLKIPADFGGLPEFKNFSLIKTHPYHDNIHHIIDLQIENNFLRVYKKIYLPWFEGKFYHD